MGIKQEFDQLREGKIITSRLEYLIEHIERGNYRDDLAWITEQITPESVRSDRQKTIGILLEAKIKKTKDPQEKQILNLLLRAGKRKQSISKTGNLEQSLALTASEILAMAAYSSKNGNTRKFLTNKARELLGFSNLNERLLIEVPENFEEVELARVLKDRLNSILSKPETEQLQALMALHDKITTTMNDEDVAVPEEEFTVLHHFKLKISGMIEER